MQDSKVTAVLGPTNTGKTHLAVERLCAHSGGMIGFPLRLLAREVYERVVAIKGPKEVGLITGEEKILPDGARWLLCTAESMPLDRDVAFVALDEAQLGSDPERGHVFTDRLLNARGREETMILGSQSLTPLIRSLVPEAEIITRPRFSKLSFAGTKKLSRLPPRSAIVAFSAEEVYAIAEMIRRARGGAAVVMGVLSPRTRNAQVAMFQAGEVDYLVATDAIGMGLNMDVSHIAFASLSKFDGHRQRRLSVSEMAQIAGRAGRHQRDGTFGTLPGCTFTDAEIERIEEHRFPALDHLYWRNGEPDYTTLEILIASLEEPPISTGLRAAPEAADLAVLKYLMGDPLVRSLATHPATNARLWEVCGLPDFRKVGAEFHAGSVSRLFGWLAPDGGRIPTDAFAAELARLDTVQGDIATLAARIAATRTWAYAAQRADWLHDPKHWAARTSALEEKLSDALHAALTQRFVDRRTTVLMRNIANDPTMLDVSVDQAGIVSVDGENIGRIDGFIFSPDPDARLDDRRRLLAAAELRLPKEIGRRAAKLAAARDHEIALITDCGQPVSLGWQGNIIATWERGRSLLEPGVKLSPAITKLSPDLRDPIEARLKRWRDELIAFRLPALVRMSILGQDPAIAGEVRAYFAQLAQGGGVRTRAEMAATLDQILPADRRRIATAGIISGSLDIFHPLLLKPEPTRLRLALLAVRDRTPMPPVPMAGLGLLDRPGPDLVKAATQAGYHSFGDQMLRVDLVERIAKSLHDKRQGFKPFTPDRKLSVSLGIGEATLNRVMRALGFVPLATPETWKWRGLRRPTALPAPTRTGAFAALEEMSREKKR